MANRRVTDVPSDKVDQVVSDFEYEDCTDITKKQQPNGLWTVEATCSSPAAGSAAGGANDGEQPGGQPPSGGVAGQPNYRSLAGGFFSSTPFDLSMKRSIRTNNPGALNLTNWQKSFPGFAGQTQPDSHGNITTIYVTPEHGVAGWFHLIADLYHFGSSGLVIRDLAQRYAGASSPAAPSVQAYIAGWRAASGNVLDAGSTISLADDGQTLILAKAMFKHEAGQNIPWADAQILEGVHRQKAGTLPAN